MTVSTSAATDPRDNLLLAGLADDAYERIAADLQFESLDEGRLLGGPSAVPDRFYFPTSGLVSLLYSMADGHAAELALVGREGGIGLPLILGGHAFPADAVVQLSATAWTIRPQALRHEFTLGGSLQHRLLLFSQALMTQIAQTAVCNRHHTIEQHLVRWILLSLDRVPGTDLRMTHESIAHMLGVRRAGVTEAADHLQRDGLVSLARGHIHVHERAALEARACECYRTIRAAYEPLERDARPR